MSEADYTSLKHNVESQTQGQGVEPQAAWTLPKVAQSFEVKMTATFCLLKISGEKY